MNEHTLPRSKRRRPPGREEWLALIWCGLFELMAFLNVLVAFVAAGEGYAWAIPLNALAAAFGFLMGWVEWQTIRDWLEEGGE